jgi:hypothetical protein
MKEMIKQTPTPPFPGVDSSAKRNGSSKSDFNFPAKPRQERLDGGSLSEAFARGEVAFVHRDTMH